MTNLKQAVNHPIFDKISRYCQENNKECFVVGGYVRDFLLNRKSKDIDILVLGSGIDIAKKIAKNLNYINTSLLLSQGKSWIESQNTEKFISFFSCKNTNDIISEFLFLI